MEHQVAVAGRRIGYSPVSAAVAHQVDCLPGFQACVHPTHPQDDPFPCVHCPIDNCGFYKVKRKGCKLKKNQIFDEKSPEKFDPPAHGGRLVEEGAYLNLKVLFNGAADIGANLLRGTFLWRYWFYRLRTIFASRSLIPGKSF